MNRIVFATVATALLTATSLPASAAEGRNTAAAAGAVGGFALGAVLGSALAAPRPVYVAPAPVYVAPAPVYVEPECHIRRERVYVRGWGWETRDTRVCY